MLVRVREVAEEQRFRQQFVNEAIRYFMVKPVRRGLYDKAEVLSALSLYCVRHTPRVVKIHSEDVLLELHNRAFAKYILKLQRNIHDGIREAAASGNVKAEAELTRVLESARPLFALL